MAGIKNAITGKSVDPTIIAALTASLTVRYGITISPETVSKIPFQTPIYDRLMSLGPPRVKPYPAATYSILSSAVFTGSGAGGAFPAGEDPYTINPSRSLTSVTKKSYGASAGIKDIDVIASTVPGAPVSINRDAFMDDAALLIDLLYRITIQSLDYDMIHGDLGSDANEFDGLETKVVSGTSGFLKDYTGGTALSAGLLEQHIVWMMASGVYPTAIYCNPVMHYALAQAYQGRSKVSINIQDAREGAMGVWAKSILTPAGELPIISDRFFTIATDGTNATGDIFLAVEYHNGVQILTPEWMLLPTAVPLSKVMGRGRATSTELAVWCHLALIERTNWWAQGRLQNLTYAYVPSVSTGSVGS